MQQQKAINSFHKGMQGDVDKHLQPEGTYRYALNGRIRFNTANPAESTIAAASQRGATYSFCNDNGNKLCALLCNGYVVVGYCDIEDECVLFSTNSQYSEIGLLTIDTATDSVAYRTLFNDQYDPNGDLLRFNVNYYITASACIESRLIRRVYFTDNYNEPRVINIERFYWRATEAATQKTPYHSIFPLPYPTAVAVTPLCGEAPTPYPFWLSVHSMSERTDVNFSKLYFEQVVDGGLKTGVYQYSYRYITADGHRTIWSPITRHLFLTSDEMPTVNQHYYQMYASNVVTNKGIKITIPEVDRRYHTIQVAYIFSITDAVTEEATIFYDQKIDEASPSLTIDHVGHSGVPVLLEEFAQLFTWLTKTPTVGIHKNKLFHGGGETMKPLWVDTSLIGITPVNKYMVGDTEAEVLYSDPEAPIGDEYTQPITNTQPQTGSLTLSTFGGLAASYPVVNDYMNYKGMQFEHLFTGHWRGETYRYGLQFFDRKGVPFFVQHIKDFTFPQQYEGQQLTRKNSIDGLYELRLLGAMFDGITIPADILFDEFGKLNISGFAIVRTKRTSPRILHQGILLNTVHEPKCDEEDGGIKKWRYTRPLTHVSNFFDLDYTDGYPDSHRYDVRFKSECNDFFDGIFGDDYTKFANRPATFTYHSPDVLIEESIKEFKKGDYMKLVGTCMKGDISVGFSALEIELDGANNHYYTKCYKTDNTIRRYEMGSESRVRKTIIYPEYGTEEGYDEYDIDLKWSPHSRYQAFDDPDVKLRAIAHPNTVLVLMKDWEAIDVVVTTDPVYPDAMRSAYHIVNYLAPQEDNVSLEQSIYQGTGHFQAINEQILSQAQHITDADGNILQYIFNNVEVWGGDCYVNYFDLCRLYGEFSNCDKDAGIFHDYSIGMVVPIESNYNIAMRYGRSFAKDASNPERTSCENSDLQFKNGVMKEQPEDWNVNACMQHEENVQFYYPKPANIRIEYRFPYRVFYSEQKTYNELDDRFRRLLPFNYSDLQGTYGEVTALATLFDYLICFQEKGYGALRINERASIPDMQGRQLILGTGTDLDGVDYISTTFGCQHRDSVVRLHHALYWVDARMGKFCRHSQAGNDRISDNYGLHDLATLALPLLSNDNLDPNFNQGRKIVAAADYTNNDVIITLYHTQNDLFPPTTVVYSEDLNTFTSYLSACPKIYIAHKNKIITPNPQSLNQNKLYLHFKGRKGEYYDVFYRTKITYICNPSPTKTVYFDSSLINVNQRGWKKIVRAEHLAENPIDSVSLIGQRHIIQLQPSDDRVIYRNDALIYPIRQKKDVDDQELPRLRGHWSEVTIEIQNDTDNQSVCITGIETNYRILNRI